MTGGWNGGQLTAEGRRRRGNKGNLYVVLGSCSCRLGVLGVLGGLGYIVGLQLGLFGVLWVILGWL